MDKEEASHSSILAWEIPRTEEPWGRESWTWLRLSNKKTLSKTLTHAHTQKNIMHQLPQLELVQGFVLFKTSDQSLHDCSSAFANASSGRLQGMVETGKCMAIGVSYELEWHISMSFFFSELVNSLNFGFLIYKRLLITDHISENVKNYLSLFNLL